MPWKQKPQYPSNPKNQGWGPQQSTGNFAKCFTSKGQFNSPNSEGHYRSHFADEETEAHWDE